MLYMRIQMKMMKKVCPDRLNKGMNWRVILLWGPILGKSTAQIARISLADFQGVKLQEAVMKTSVGSVL